jgi:hypothetical protein
MKKLYYKKQQIKLLKNLNVKDKAGEWAQIEILTGKNKGQRKPITTKEIN